MHEYFGFLPFLGGGEHGLIGEGLVFGHSDYANTFYVTTTFHGCHVTAGVIYLSVILINTLRGKYGDNPAGPVELVGLFWHFVDLVWILVFTLIYLIP
jgi:heme/copper-type cytochrome/quinol oxidase subunit 3